MKSLFLAGAVSALAVLAGCATAPQVRDVNLGYRSVGDGIILTPGVEIVDEAGAFHMTAGQPWPVPFSLGDECILAPDASAPDAGLLTGARRVRVTVPSLDEPLYGLLQLCGVPPEATGPATRRYNLEVPQSYVERTAGGLVSLVYEPHQGQLPNGTPKAWILWLSRSPFPPPTGRAVSLMTARSAAQEEANATAARQSASDNAGGDTLLWAGLGGLLVIGLALGLFFLLEEDML